MSRIAFLALLVGLLSATLAFARVVPIVSSVNAEGATEGKPFPLSITLAQSQGVSKVVLFYRAFGETEFRDLEMLLAGRNASVTLPVELMKPPSIEYYVSVEMTNGTTSTHPIQSPDASPLRLTVRQANPKDLEVRVLSPEPGETVAAEELVVAVSLFYASDAVDRKSTRLYLDGVDVTSNAIMADDMLLYSPQNFPRALNLGTHFIKVELRDTKGAVYHTVESSFNLSTSAAIAAEKARFRAGIAGQAEFRNEDLSSGSTSYTRVDLRLNSSYGAMNFGGNVYLDNQEDPGRQPQNRYSFSGQTDFLRLHIGDAYPQFPTLLMSGKRVRGFSGNLTLGFFNLDVTLGQGTRSIEGVVDSSVAVDSSKVPSLPLNTRLVSGRTYAYFSQGTYARDFLAVRPSFGSGENFQLGFSYMKAKDDIGSIKYGVTPQENAAIGSDLLIAFDNQRFKLQGQAALTLNNTDISGGSFTDADYDSLEAQNKDLGKTLKQIRPIAESIITVNENLFPSNPVGSGMPGVSLEGSLTLNYLNNYIQAVYFRRGAAYRSLGNEYLQTDIEGFLVSDRIRMFSNRVYLSLSYEQKNDNTSDTKRATTTFSNLTTAVTVTPLRFPSFTVGYGIYGRESDDLVTRPLLPTNLASERKKSADEKTARIFLGSNYDFTLGARQSFTLNASFSTREDKTFYKRDQKNNYIAATVTTTYQIPLRTTVGINVNTNESDLRLFTGSGIADVRDTTTMFDYTTLILGGQYRLLNDNLALALTVAPSFGDLKRTSLQFGADYAISDRHALELLVNYINNTDFGNDMIAGLIYRFNF